MPVSARELEEHLMSSSLSHLTAKLHSVGHFYWNHPETSDCTVLIPISAPTRSTQPSNVSAARHASICSTSSVNTSLTNGLDRLNVSAPTSYQLSLPRRNHEAEQRDCSEESPSFSRRDSGVHSSNDSVMDVDGETIRTSTVTTPATPASTLWPRRVIPLQVLNDDETAGGRRGSAPSLKCPNEAAADKEVMVTYRLHTDFLVTQSSLFRSILSTSGPLNLESGSPSSSSTTMPFLNANANRQPRLVSKPSEKPALLLPLPDPASFPALLHYFYEGDFDRLTQSMERGEVRWEAVILNAQYLGLNDDLKQKLGSWWNARKRQLCTRPARGREPFDFGIRINRRSSGSEALSVPSPRTTSRSEVSPMSNERFRRESLKRPRQDETGTNLGEERARTPPRYGFGELEAGGHRRSIVEGSTFLPPPLPTGFLSSHVSPRLPLQASASSSSSSSRRSVAGALAVREWLGKTRRRPRAISSLAYYCNTTVDNLTEVPLEANKVQKEGGMVATVSKGRPRSKTTVERPSSMLSSGLAQTASH